MPNPTPQLPTHYTGPGLLDIQVNGYAGFDFNGEPAAWSAEALHDVRRCLLKRGVVAVLPTLVTDAPGLMLARARRYGELVQTDTALAAVFPRLHIEGPFLSPADGPRGAHPKAHCATPAAQPDLIDRLNEAAAGRVGLVTLAPELDGAIALIERLARAGIVPAIGHTMADAETLGRAVAAGARLSTHLGNGSHAELHRLNNYIQHQLADDRLWASFIADGHHMPLTTLQNFIRAKTPQRTILTTDAIAAAEMPPGRYIFGGETVESRPDGYVGVPGATNLAGSSLTLDRAVVAVAIHCGVAFDAAWAMASTRPAELLGLPAPETVTVAVGVEGFERQG